MERGTFPIPEISINAKLVETPIEDSEGYSMFPKVKKPQEFLVMTLS